MLHTFRFHQFLLMKISESIPLKPRKPILCFTSIILYSCSMNCEDESSLCLCTRNPWRLFSKIFAKQWVGFFRKNFLDFLYSNYLYLALFRVHNFYSAVVMAIFCQGYLLVNHDYSLFIISIYSCQNRVA